jgi:hypothetical protein
MAVAAMILDIVMKKRLPETTIALPDGDCNMTVGTVNSFLATGGIAH